MSRLKSFTPFCAGMEFRLPAETCLPQPDSGKNRVFVYDNDTLILYPYVMEGVHRERIRISPVFHLRQRLEVNLFSGLQARCEIPETGGQVLPFFQRACG